MSLKLPGHERISHSPSHPHESDRRPTAPDSLLCGLLTSHMQIHLIMNHADTFDLNSAIADNLDLNSAESTLADCIVDM